MAEAILAFVPLSPLETKAAAFFTNSLIALGVYGELFFHRRSSLAQGELLRRSKIDLRVTNSLTVGGGASL